MAAANRANVFTACQKVVKKHYESAGPEKRTILEQLVFAAILENAPRKIADAAFEHLKQEYFDWNEVRVTSTTELMEAMPKHPSADAAAARVRLLLQNVFESIYSFDLEELKKGNQGKAVITIEKFGATPFIVGYITQHGLGGHSIPMDRSLLNLMFVLGAISDKDLEKGAVPGLERAIPKTKGIEFADMIHELAVDFQMAPFSKKIRDLLLEIAPDAKSRFPKRVTEEPAPAPKAEPAEEKSSKKKSEAHKKKAATKKAEPAKPAKTTKSTKAAKASTPKTTAPKKKTAKTAKKKTTPTKAATKKTTKKTSSSRITKKKPK